ncbi:GPI anchored protein [Rasamsonia emersonii CBS 393.64]|uniref:GPI anchored protein n=1 Tax=Rasamsonia emersonii (strain ATCC 16479 / CBS 393.64 / IMI 116815) TaxID=1408163 RepID=A0A0F4YXU9_RASE3|nr:GPI anchored protein [Rasamsonia emersonii CBS 393.64]KKA23079.1 GPI anchored protein [Rasamsonia emersonii CBS 393.64]
MPWYWILLFVLRLGSFEGTLGKELSPSYGLRESWASSQVRRKLSAATVSSQLERRSQSSLGLFKEETVFHYLHEADDTFDDSVFAASLSVKSREPLLVVEDLENELKDVVCSNSQISLFFNAPGGFDAVKEAFQLNGSFIVVTSHDGCNLDGERATYRASKAVIDAANSAVHVEVSRCEWRDAFIDTHVSFFRRHPSENQMHRRTLERRQQSQVTTPAATTILITGSGPTPTVSFPTVPSVTSELPSTATKTLDVSLVDEVIFPPQNLLAEQLIPQGVTVSCKNCSIGGTIEISEASFSLPDSDNGPIEGSIDVVNETITFFENGSVEAVATGLFAHIELELSISESQDLESLNIELPTIPLTPFEIPGVVAFGPLIAPELVAGITLAESMNFTYGMNLSVPDNSKLEINMRNLANSTASGL